MTKMDKLLRKFDEQFDLTKFDKYLGCAIKNFIRSNCVPKFKDTKIEKGEQHGNQN